MKRFSFLAAFFCACYYLFSQTIHIKNAVQGVDGPPLQGLIANAQTDDAKMQWWLDDKFGLFLHFGVYSIGHDGNGKPQKSNEHYMFYTQTPIAEYSRRAAHLTLEDYNPDAWVKMAKDAGMKYVVITAKHHDGFAMYNSAANDFNIVKKSTYGKDPMVPLAAACKKYGLKMCFYYSLGRD